MLLSFFAIFFRSDFSKKLCQPFRTAGTSPRGLFALAIDIAFVRPTAIESVQRGWPSGMKKRVLVVEDYEDTRILLKFMIEKFGYSVIEASGPYEAIDKAAEFKPDLILMDIGMPLLDGLSVAQAIHGKKINKSVPIVAVTAFSDIEDEAAKAGCSEVIYKPVDPDRLREVLVRYIG